MGWNGVWRLTFRTSYRILIDRKLVEMLGCGKVLNGSVDVYPNPEKAPTIRCRVSRVNKILGIDISREEMTGYLPVTKSVAEYEGMEEFWNENPLYKVAYDQAQTGHCQEQPYSPHLQDLTQACWDAVSLLIADQSIDAEQAVEQIKVESESYFG